MTGESWQSQKTLSGGGRAWLSIAGGGHNHTEHCPLLVPPPCAIRQYVRYSVGVCSHLFISPLVEWVCILACDRCWNWGLEGLCNLPKATQLKKWQSQNSNLGLTPKPMLFVLPQLRVGETSIPGTRLEEGVKHEAGVEAYSWGVCDIWWSVGGRIRVCCWAQSARHKANIHPSHRPAPCIWFSRSENN